MKTDLWMQRFLLRFNGESVKAPRGTDLKSSEFCNSISLDL